MVTKFLGLDCIKPPSGVRWGLVHLGPLTDVAIGILGLMRHEMVPGFGFFLQSFNTFAMLNDFHRRLPIRGNSLSLRRATATRIIRSFVFSICAIFLNQLKGFGNFLFSRWSRLVRGWRFRFCFLLFSFGALRLSFGLRCKVRSQLLVDAVRHEIKQGLFLVLRRYKERGGCRNLARNMKTVFFQLCKLFRIKFVDCTIDV